MYILTIMSENKASVYNLAYYTISDLLESCHVYIMLQRSLTISTDMGSLYSVGAQIANVQMEYIITYVVKTHMGGHGPQTPFLTNQQKDILP